MNGLDHGKRNSGCLSPKHENNLRKTKAILNVGAPQGDFRWSQDIRSGACPLLDPSVRTPGPYQMVL